MINNSAINEVQKEPEFENKEILGSGAGETINLCEVNVEFQDKKSYKCPKIKVQVQGVNVEALIDTGSEITCISEDFYNENHSSFEECPCLPVVGTTVTGATGGRPVKIIYPRLLL